MDFLSVRVDTQRVTFTASFAQKLNAIRMVVFSRIYT